MANMGDFFPEKMKEENAKFNLTPGSVIKCFVQNTTPPKEKRFVILGQDKNGNFVGNVFINSNINFSVMNSQELLDLQYFIENSSNDFLDWDSYIDCTDIFELEYDTIKQLLTREPERALGKLAAEDFTEVCKLVKQSPLIEPVLLKKYQIQ